MRTLQKEGIKRIANGMEDNPQSPGQSILNALAISQISTFPIAKCKHLIVRSLVVAD